MKTKFIIYTSRGLCNCFSLQDLYENLKHAIQERLVIRRVEAA